MFFTPPLMLNLVLRSSIMNAPTMLRFFVLGLSPPVFLLNGGFFSTLSARPWGMPNVLKMLGYLLILNDDLQHSSQAKSDPWCSH